MPAVNEYKDGVVARLYKGLQGLVKSRKITYVEGNGRLVGPTDGRGRRPALRGPARRARHRLRAQEPARAWRSTAERGHHQRPRAAPRLGARLGGRARRRRDRLRVRQRLAVLRRRGDDRRGAAAPGAARGRAGVQGAGARLPQARHRLRARRAVRRGREHRHRRHGSRWRTARRSRPSCCSSPSAAARSPQDLGYEEAGVEMERGFVKVDELLPDQRRRRSPRSAT